MPFARYRYPDEVPQELEDVAGRLYRAVIDFRASQVNVGANGQIDPRSPGFGGYNVASFLVRLDAMTTYTLTSRSDRAQCVHSEDRIVEELAEIGTRKGDVLAVFTEWPPCVRPRAEEREVWGPGIEFTYQPHSCSTMLNNVLNDGTPVFHARGPVL
jgi:hypothetical protein